MGIGVGARKHDDTEILIMRKTYHNGQARFTYGSNHQLVYDHICSYQLLYISSLLYLPDARCGYVCGPCTIVGCHHIPSVLVGCIQKRPYHIPSIRLPSAGDSETRGIRAYHPLLVVPTPGPLLGNKH